jgi:hypothetical protein
MVFEVVLLIAVLLWRQVRLPDWFNRRIAQLPAAHADAWADITRRAYWERGMLLSGDVIDQQSCQVWSRQTRSLFPPLNWHYMALAIQSCSPENASFRRLLDCCYSNPLWASARRGEEPK